MNIPESLQSVINNLIINAKISIGDVKVVALDQAWKVLQLATAETIQAIENSNPSLAGKDKKELAMIFLSTFYDSVFITVSVPFVPSFLQPIIHRSIKSLLMILVSSTIDALVTTFRNSGIFTKKTETSNG